MFTWAEMQNVLADNDRLQEELAKAKSRELSNARIERDAALAQLRGK